MVCAASLASGACFLRLVLANEVVETISDAIDRHAVAVHVAATVAICEDLAFPNLPVTCSYFVDGVPIASTARLTSELGLFGVLVDPLIIELPAGATGLAGTYDDGAGHSGNLSIYPQLSYVPVDDHRTLTPEPGTQLAIADLPPGAPIDNVTYDYQFTFQQLAPAGAGPTTFKAIMAAKVVQNGKTFYPPMLPCVESFASVPETTVPRSPVLETVTLPGGLAGCNNKMYGFFRNEVGPSMACDLDNDHDVDRNDVALVMAVRNRVASPGDPRDVNQDGVINADDARMCTTQCTRAQCKS